MFDAKTWKVTILITLSILFVATLAQAKRAPGPESIVNKPFVRPQGGGTKAIINAFDNDGYITRLYFPQFQSAFKDTRQIVEDYLGQNNSILGNKKDRTDLNLFSIRHSIAGYHYRYQQVYQGVPVFGRWIAVNIRYNGTISSVMSDYKHNINLSTIPDISADEALQKAIADVGVTSYRGQSQTELVVYANGSEPTLCWKALILAEKPLGDWQVFVDAHNGNIVDKDNIMEFVDGHGYIFDPNPVVSTQNTNLMDSTNRDYPALTNARILSVLKELNDPQGGYYYLSGPFANTAATPNRVHIANPDSFLYNRSNNHFEEVMAYFQIDSCARVYEALGFDDIMQHSQNLDVDGVTDDNSWFSPGNLTITYGTGGVDDAEDGDVIVHEYGHATQYDEVPGWGQQEEGGAMGEGFGDYLTVAVFHPISGGWHEAQVFDWDANPRDHFWPGRRVDGNKHYPENMDGEVHDDGEIWSRCLWDIFNSVGWDTSLTLVLESHFDLTPQAHFIDGANAIVQADMDLYGGRHLMAIGQAFVNRGIFSEMPVHLDIVHTPLMDTEDSTGSYDVFATITHTFPIDSMLLYYRYDTTSQFNVGIMGPTVPPPPDQYATSLPGPGHSSRVFYYIKAIDSMSFTNTLPAQAPAQTFSFYVGADTVRPLITHQQLHDMPAVNWPPHINATVTDNLGVDSVWCEFMINHGPVIIVALGRNDTTSSLWTGVLVDTVMPGDSIQYRIKARDRSSHGNVAYLPSTGYYSFTILDLQSLTYMRNGFQIPDFGHGAKYDTLNIPNHLSIFEADVYINLHHQRISDLYFWIRDPRNHTVTLHNRTGGDGDSIVGWYDDDIAPDGPGNMNLFVGDSCQGNWLLYMADRAAGDTGIVNSWGIRIIGSGQPTGVDDNGGNLPTAFNLNQNYPNPFNPSTNISFNLPQSGAVKLEIFDILGRKAATLIDGNLIAGSHTVVWDGKSNGRPASSGIYFARLTSGKHSAVVRMALLK
jgi:subtilisin-like proprotein convertase family protein